MRRRREIGTPRGGYVRDESPDWPYGTHPALLCAGEVASVYPGYEGPGGFGPVLTVTLYGLLDGAVGGWLLAWLYDLAADPGG